jgi:hypothetical protein
VALVLCHGCSSHVPAGLATCSDPTRLACTGLYGREPAARDKRIADGVEAYEPGLRLWSDGLEKVRYVYLPPGALIDTRDMDEWTFPVGTKFWKEFRWRGQRIETRYLEKTGPETWRRTTFVWSSDGSDAREEKEGRTVMLEAGHGAYDIPGEQDCGRCHGGRRDNVLGFEALALAAPGATGATLARLEAQGRLTRVPDSASTAVPGTAIDQGALGWLHMNCGVSCHNANPEAGASFAGLNLKLAAGGPADPRQTPALRTALNRPTTVLGFRDSKAPKIRLVPGEPRSSAIYFRASCRAPALAMPPLATHLVDQEAMATLERWILALAGTQIGSRQP